MSFLLDKETLALLWREYEANGAKRARSQNQRAAGRHPAALASSSVQNHCVPGLSIFTLE
jgi:hypothetical protein